MSSADRCYEEDDEHNKKAAIFSTVGSEVVPEQRVRLTPQGTGDKPVKATH